MKVLHGRRRPMAFRLTGIRCPRLQRNRPSPVRHFLGWISIQSVVAQESPQQRSSRSPQSNLWPRCPSPARSSWPKLKLQTPFSPKSTSPQRTRLKSVKCRCRCSRSCTSPYFQSTIRRDHSGSSDHSAPWRRTSPLPY